MPLPAGWVGRSNCSVRGCSAYRINSRITSSRWIRKRRNCGGLSAAGRTRGRSIPAADGLIAAKAIYEAWPARGDAEHAAFRRGGGNGDQSLASLQPRPFMLNSNRCVFRTAGMAYDKDKVDEMVLALLHLTSWQDGPATCTWKTLRIREAMDRLSEKGYISKSEAEGQVGCADCGGSGEGCGAISSTLRRG